MNEKQKVIADYYRNVYQDRNNDCLHFKMGDLQKMTSTLNCYTGDCQKLNQSNKTYYFLPLAFPKKKVDFVFICKEPSGGGKPLKTKQHPSSAINFISTKVDLSRINIMIYAFLQVYNDKIIHLTDLSKCAMSTTDADKFPDVLTDHRYYQCSPFLKWELDNLTKADYKIVLVGKNLFFNRWFKDNKPDKDKYDSISTFVRFMNKQKIDINPKMIYEVPHYAIRFSAPDLFLEVVKGLKNDHYIKNVKKELKNDAVPQLYNYYLDNYCFNENTEKEIRENLNNYKPTDQLSDSKIFLYLLFKYRFENIKNPK